MPVPKWVLVTALRSQSSLATNRGNEINQRFFLSVRTVRNGRRHELEGRGFESWWQDLSGLNSSTLAIFQGDTECYVASLKAMFVTLATFTAQVFNCRLFVGTFDWAKLKFLGQRIERKRALLSFSCFEIASVWLCCMFLNLDLFETFCSLTAKKNISGKMTYLALQPFCH